MQFRTELISEKYSQSINYQDKIISIGSCFASFIGNTLSSNKFDVCNNPYGTIFNPLSITYLINKALQDDFSWNIVFHNEQYHCFDVHSSLSENIESELIEKLNNIQIEFKNYLLNSKWLIITLGTAWVYELIEQQKTVANCHKIPNNQFNKILLTHQEIEKNLIEALELVKSKNREIETVLTVSPVRHIKDTLVLNNVSKSQLLISVYNVIQHFKSEISYFPAYEFVQDDLRDYRFYEADLLHPNAIAQQYIFEKFKEIYFNEETIKLLQSLQKAINNFNHRPIQVNSIKYLQHLQTTLNQLNELSNKLNVNTEIEVVNQKIQTINLK
ncbi:MAG: hypothetical protein RLZZ175_1086 [Bacteroidota bacterium]|jgi:hypothetical protein